jgi:ATP-binding cassette subfamily B protein
MEQLTAYAWEEDRLSEALAALAQQAGLIRQRPPDRSLPSPNSAGTSEISLSQWIENAAICLGFEATPVRIAYTTAALTLAWIGPAILRLDASTPRYLAVLKSTRHKLILLAPNLRAYHVSLRRVQEALCPVGAVPEETEIDRWLEEAEIPRSRRATARTILLAERIGPASFDCCWRLQLAPNVSFWRKALHCGLPQRLSSFVLAYTAYYSLWILSWWILGQSALQGRIDKGWLIAWSLLLFSQVPFQLCSNWAQRMTALGAGMLLKQHLLYGTTRLDPGQVKSQGTGLLLGKVIESETIEVLSLSGGLLQIIALIELAAAAAILHFSAFGSSQVWLLAAWLGFAGLTAWLYYRRRQSWTKARLGLSQYLIDQMGGYRTSLAQQLPEFRHLHEDQRLEEYLQASILMDNQSSYLTTLIPRGWLVLGLLGLAGAFWAGTATPAAMAVAIGGLLLAYRAFAKLSSGLVHLVDARITWEQIAVLFEAAKQPIITGTPAFAMTPAHGGPGGSHSPLLEIRELSFCYPNRSYPVITQCNMQIHTGEQFWLQGASGAGKSTLIALLMGLYPPHSGLILFSGLDRQTLGSEAWQRRILAVPQFHQNYLLTESLAFNLLMGHRWPPRHEDLLEAEGICRDLGLGDLLNRMPAGLQQVVGESGWTLSHGERSRLYIARALLQKAPLLVLDEGCTFLDPENLQQVIDYVQKKAPTLILVAHP